MTVSCPHCQARIEPHLIDRERDIATCSNCSRLIDIRDAPDLSVPSVRPPSRSMRPSVGLPSGMSLKVNGGLTLRRPWLRTKHWIFLVVLLGLSGVVGFLWANEGPGTWLIIATLVIASWNYNLLCAFVNSTWISADDAGIKVRHGPLPSILALSRSIPKDDVKQLFAAKHGALFSVKALVHSKSDPLILASPLASAEQAMFVEQQLERVLGIEDFAVEGELAQVSKLNVEGGRQPGARSGAWVALAAPISIGSILGLFFFSIQSEVEGAVHISVPSGDWSMAPDECYSGEREGFAGVVLVDSKAPGRKLRIVSDPVKGDLIVVVDPAQPLRVIDRQSCGSLSLRVERSNTNINDVWAMNGEFSVDCPELRGRATFSTCH